MTRTPTVIVMVIVIVTIRSPEMESATGIRPVKLCFVITHNK
jgi:hypothetical protein